MGTDVDTGQPDERDGAQDKSTASRAETGKGGGAERDGHGAVPGQVPEPRGLPAAVAGLLKQRHRPGPAHHLLDELRKPPGHGPPGKEPACQLMVSGQPGRSGRRWHRAQGAELHDDPDGPVNRVRQAVNGLERRCLPGLDAAAARCTRRGQQRRDAHAEPDAGIGQHTGKPSQSRVRRCWPGGICPVTGAC